MYFNDYTYYGILFSRFNFCSWPYLPSVACNRTKPMHLSVNLITLNCHILNWVRNISSIYNIHSKILSSKLSCYTKIYFFKKHACYNRCLYIHILTFIIYHLHNYSAFRTATSCPCPPRPLARFAPDLEHQSLTDSHTLLGKIPSKILQHVVPYSAMWKILPRIFFIRKVIPAQAYQM